MLQPQLLHSLALDGEFGQLLGRNHGQFGAGDTQFQFLVQAHIRVADDIKRQVALFDLVIDGGRRALQHHHQLGILGPDAVIGRGVVVDIQLAEGAAVVAQEE